MRSCTAVIGVLSVACGIMLTLRGACCDEFTDEKRPYEFGFNIEGQQHRHEKKDSNGIIQGEFGFITADGIYHITVYATDVNGDFKILSMKNIRVSPPLDGPSPYNPSLQGNAGSKQEKSMKPTSSIVVSRAPVAVVNNPPVITEPITPIVKVFTGCSGCKVPVNKSPQDLGSSPDLQPPGPSYPVNSRTTQSTIFTPEEYSLISPRTDKPVNISGFQNSGRNVITPNKYFGGNSPYNITNTVLAFPISQNNQTTNKFTENTGTNQPSVSQFDIMDKPVLKPSTTPSYRNIQYEIPVTSRFPINQEYQPKSMLFPPLKEPINGQNFGVVAPGLPSMLNKNLPTTAKSSELPKATKKSLTDQTNNAVIPPSVKLQNPLLFLFDKSPIGVEKDGLPPGISEDDIKAIFYKFNYTVGFHGHYESGYRNGDKQGGYFFNGRDGFHRNVQYVANEFGFQPNITLRELGLDSKFTPKEETEKQFGLKGYEFKWFYRR